MQPLAIASCFFRFGAALFVVLATVTAPIVQSLGMVDAGSFIVGMFGACQGDYCSPSTIGYDLKNLMTTLPGGQHTADLLQSVPGKLMVLHPMVVLVLVISAVLCLSTNPKLLCVAHWLDAVSMFLLVCALLIDFYLYSALKTIISVLTDLHARFGPGFWLVVTSNILVVCGWAMLARQRRLAAGEGGDLETGPSEGDAKELEPEDKAA